jgi:hypothetical protein
MTRLSASVTEAAGGEATCVGVEAPGASARAAGGTANAALAKPTAAANTGTNPREERADSAGDRLNLEVLFCPRRIGRSQITVCIFLKSDFRPNATRFSTTNVGSAYRPGRRKAVEAESLICIEVPVRPSSFKVAATAAMPQRP